MGEIHRHWKWPKTYIMGIIADDDRGCGRRIYWTVNYGRMFDEHSGSVYLLHGKSVTFSLAGC